MHISLITCILLFLFFGPFSLQSTMAKSTTESVVPLLASQHKFKLGAIKGSINSTSEQGCNIVILQRESASKRRPADYGRLTSEHIRRKLSAKSAIVIDSVTGKTIYAHAEDVPSQPASTIKILTGLISIDSLNNKDDVKVSRRAARMPRSKIYLRIGRKYPANDLINAVLLASANDASVALAEKIGGSEIVFAKLMTAKARSLGAKETICKTASGLTAQGQKTTARDLALIFNKAMENIEFADKMVRRKVKSKSGSMIYSHNKALWRINGALGGKTGYTDVARQTYVGKFKRGDDELVVAFLGSEAIWDDLKRLVEFGFQMKRQINKADIAQRKLELPFVQLGRPHGNANPFILSSIR